MENYIWLFILFFVVFYLLRQRKRKITVAKHILMNKRRKEIKEAMKELAEQFIGKECIVYTLTGNDAAVKGIIKSVTDGGIILERPDSIEAVNLEYIARIREWPRNSKGKKNQIFD